MRIPPSELEKHLTLDCDLSIVEHDTLEQTEPLTLKESRMLQQFPEHSAPVQTMDELASTQWYEQEIYDRVLSVRITNLDSAASNIDAARRLRAMCERLNCTQTSKHFRAQDRLCMRVLNNG